MIAIGWFQRIMNLLNLDFNMCLIINSAIHKKLFGKYIPIRIKKDLVVYKYVNFNREESNPTLVTSPMLNFTYTIGNTYSTKFGIEGEYKNEVLEGYHSFTDIRCVRTDIRCNNFLGCNGIATCIIPKGSKVFLSWDGEIVSNKIKIIKVEKR